MLRQTAPEWWSTANSHVSLVKQECLPALCRTCLSNNNWYHCNSIVVFTTNWKFWCCFIHCLFDVSEYQWLIYTHTFPFIPKCVLCFHWLYVLFMNTWLVIMSVSLRTQTGLHCLIIQALTQQVWFLNIQYTSFISVWSNLEHGLAILTESFSPLKSVLHNLSWSPNQKSTSIDTQYNSLTSVALHNII